MTSGRGLVLGEPGPWRCPGMTGGVVCWKLDEVMGLVFTSLFGIGCFVLGYWWFERTRKAFADVL